MPLGGNLRAGRRLRSAARTDVVQTERIPWMTDHRARLLLVTLEARPARSPRKKGATSAFGVDAPNEVDKAVLDVGVDELDAHPITDVKALEAAHDLSLHGQLEDADPRTLLGRTSHDRVKLLADPRCEKLCGGGLSHLPLDLGRVVFLVGAVASQRVQLVVAVWDRPVVDSRLDQP